MTAKLCPVILAGGGGTRLWPLSRRYYPKQFLSLDGDKSMLQKTLLRMDGMNSDIEVSPATIICNEEHRFLVAEHAQDVNQSPGEIILEPVGRNTAPALTVAALKAAADDVLLMMPADHVIRDTVMLQDCIKAGYRLACENFLVTFGILPTQPETGYGYIRTGREPLEDHDEAAEIEEFVEKPDMQTAVKYLESGRYYWNSGIFMMRAEVWLEAIQKYESEIYKQCKLAVDGGAADGVFFRVDKAAFEQCPDNSIDYAVMENAPKSDEFRAALVELDAGWSDIGSWSAVWEIGQKNGDDNVTRGDVIARDTHNSIIFAEHKLVTTVGLEDVLVIETADAVLVGNRNKAQDVKKVVDELQEKEREERLTHRKVYRPWGSYESLDAGDNFQVKRLTVKPGKKLSLQMHHHRAEHWVVVSGVATVTRGEEVYKLNQNESTFIPLGEKHRLENTGNELLEVIEVQSGSYLGEDDIVRFDDDFGRVEQKK